MGSWLGRQMVWMVVLVGVAIETLIDGNICCNESDRAEGG